ncbi:MAG: 1-(5-phosphoribosyl)-5-[(5-phosphoribosylamino)methylideneamino] imidazole-4-carboxamide isomerase, partial [Saprospiraceae bacterium]
FEAHGLQYLHLVDLEGARSNGIVNHKILYEIATKTSLKIEFGGGLKKREDVIMAFEHGASQIIGGSVAFQNPELFLEWVSTYGAEKVILGADAKTRKIATQGWLQSSDTDVVDFIAAYVSKGIEYVICTDIARDGMLQGASIELYQEILARTKVKLVASGGVSSVTDLEKLRGIGCDGAIIGKAIYEQKISLKELINLV